VGGDFNLNKMLGNLIIKSSKPSMLSQLKIPGKPEASEGYLSVSPQVLSPPNQFKFSSQVLKDDMPEPSYGDFGITSQTEGSGYLSDDNQIPPALYVDNQQETKSLNTILPEEIQKPKEIVEVNTNQDIIQLRGGAFAEDLNKIFNIVEDRIEDGCENVKLIKICRLDMARFGKDPKTLNKIDCKPSNICEDALKDSKLLKPLNCGGGGSSACTFIVSNKDWQNTSSLLSYNNPIQTTFPFVDAKISRGEKFITKIFPKRTNENEIQREIEFLLDRRNFPPSNNEDDGGSNVVSIVPLDLGPPTKYIFNYEVESLDKSTQFKFQGFFLNHANKEDLESFLLKESNQTFIEPQKTDDILDILYQISNGMDYMNKNKWIHRDLALRNILVFQSKSGTNVYKITDFGLALKLDGQSICGDLNSIELKTKCPGWGKVSVNEADPEQLGRFIKDIKWNYESDIWSFGILFWILIGGGDEKGKGMKKIYEKLFNDIYILLAKLIYGINYNKGDHLEMKRNLFKIISRFEFENYILIEIFGREISSSKVFINQKAENDGKAFMFRILYRLIVKLRDTPPELRPDKKYNIFTLLDDNGKDGQKVKKERKATIKNLPKNIFTKDNENKYIGLNHKLFNTLLKRESYVTKELPALVKNVLIKKRIDYFKQLQLEIMNKDENYPGDTKMLNILNIMSQCFNPSEKKKRPSFNELKLKFKKLKEEVSN